MELGLLIKYPIEIEPSDNKGFIVKAGCGKFTFSDARSLIKGMEEYLYNPQKLEDEYNKARGGIIATRAFTEPPTEPALSTRR